MRRAKDTTYIFMKKSTGEKIVHAFMFVLFMAYALTLLVPLFWLLTQCFHANDGSYQSIIMHEGHFAMPKKWHFENYLRAYSLMNYNGYTFFEMTFNTLWYMAIGNTWCLFWSIITAYVFAKYDFAGRKEIRAVLIFTLLVPIAGSSGAMIKIVTEMGIYDKGPLFVIITGIGGFNGSFLIYTAIFKGLAWDYAESVFVDGGGNFTAFVHIMLPMAMPAIFALMVKGMIGQWNEYTQFMYFMPSTPPLAMGLYFVSFTVDRFGKPMYYSSLVIAMIPVLIIYAFMAEKMMKNMQIGGLKG